MKRDLEQKVENALPLEEVLNLPRGFNVAENVVGQQIYIWRSLSVRGTH